VKNVPIRNIHISKLKETHYKIVYSLTSYFHSVYLKFERERERGLD